uniref:Uncharacterized protein n=1 Tax=Panagrolaimus sp. PS1159 TaxID=55785 RepID=A0AC35FYQ3_9BILA
MRFSLLGGTLTVLTLFIGATLFQGVFTKDNIINNNNKDYEEDYISDDGRYQEFSAGKGERGLFPNIFNLATHADIRSTATCGQHNPEYYCKLVEHVFARAPQCDICDANNHLKNHPIEYAIDGTPRWWQSPSLGNGLSYEKVNITLDLRQEYQIAYVIIKAGNAPRPGTWVLEKSLDGINYSPWQYYATSDAQCMKAFGVPASHGVPKFSTDDEVICTSFYSRLDPLDNGEIHTSLVNGRPSAEHPTQTLQNFTRARFVRIRLLSLRTLNADLMIINNRDQKLDQSVTRRYFYSIKDISIGGQCICYGHAESCPPEEVHGQFRCECRHNTCGESCNQCCPLYNQLPWQPGTHAQPNVCQACQCFNHADECVYDESIAIQKLSVTPDGIYEGGGKCVDCRDNTEGINCEKCKYGFYRPSNISHYQNDACHACNCDTLGSEHNECVRDETAAFNGHRPGDCICKPGFGGRRCEKCAPGYRNYPICEPCPCNPLGSLNFDTCEEENCICKSNVEGKFCDQCKPGTIFLNQNNPQGCQPCFCFGKSTDCKEGNWAVGKISSSQNWNLTGLHNYNENVVPQTNSSELLIFTSSDFERENSLYYWKAPPPFSGNLLNSYGGDLHYYVYFVPQRDSGHPTPVADVIIEGNGIRLEHYSRINFFPRENISVTIPILERQGWYNSQTRQPIDKSDLMRALSDVKYFLIRARYNQEQLQSRFV